MNELHAAVLLPFLVQTLGWAASCDECRDGGVQERPCHGFVGLTSEGAATDNPHDPTIVVNWPECPMRWAKVRAHGMEAATLAGILRWKVEREEHKRRHVGAGAARLYREYLRVREMPENLRMAAARKGGDS